MHRAESRDWNGYLRFDMQRITLEELKHILFYAFRDHLTMKDIENIIINEEESLKENSGNCQTEFEGAGHQFRTDEICTTSLCKTSHPRFMESGGGYSRTLMQREWEMSLLLSFQSTFVFVCSDSLKNNRIKNVTSDPSEFTRHLIHCSANRTNSVKSAEERTEVAAVRGEAGTPYSSPLEEEPSDVRTEEPHLRLRHGIHHQRHAHRGQSDVEERHGVACPPLCVRGNEPACMCMPVVGDFPTFSRNYFGQLPEDGCEPAASGCVLMERVEKKKGTMVGGKIARGFPAGKAQFEAFTLKVLWLLDRFPPACLSVSVLDGAFVLPT
ncbi:Calcium-binding protein 8 [Collichthys lucidus]|uniref:Calcium-binding protein 8 n=1 Tax=Collichthys lucidus TaxID=240159 RepID=A0A4U5V2Z6_COLLU|nr:Calcium-binding protein 8 [Collichthys lucidus]